jgi:hypothetical protein
MSCFIMYAWADMGHVMETWSFGHKIWNMSGQ